MKFHGHFHEERIIQLKNRAQGKTKVWNAFRDSGLLGIYADDCSIEPRILPLSYFSTIESTARQITLFVLKLLDLPPREIKAIIPHGPIRDFLIEDLEVLKYRPERRTGSFRFDMAIVGPPKKGNVPRLLEINEIGFDGLARSSYIQELYLNLFPHLKKKGIVFDAARAEIRNMMRIGKTVARLQYDLYNWEEEVLIRRGKEKKIDIQLISPSDFGCDIKSKYHLLRQEDIYSKNGQIVIGKDFRPDLLQIGYSFELSDYKEAPSLYKKLVRNTERTPQYSPFMMGLVASKMILVLLNDTHLRRKLLGSSQYLKESILPAFPLNGVGNFEKVRQRSPLYVLKYTDGLGGEQVFLGADLLKKLNKIPKKEWPHWIAQKRIRLNTIDVHGILSRPRRVIADLGVFVQYDWSKGKLRHFEIGGFITRATNRSFKVNVSGGGLQVPVFFMPGANLMENSFDIALSY